MCHARCPHCRMGAIFRGSIIRGFPKMHDRCPVCDLRYEREPGYFLGAMYISYAIGVPLLGAIVGLFWYFTDWSVNWLMIAGGLAFLPLVPAITLFSRVLWLYLDHAVDPVRDT